MGLTATKTNESGATIKRAAQRGFTVVELLIVIVVIAILATISATTYSGMQQRAKNVVRISDARKMKNLIVYYLTVNGAASIVPLIPTGAYYCIGSNYPDIDPGVGKSCYEFFGGYDRSLPALDSALAAYGNYSVSAISPVKNGSADWDEQSSSPEVVRFSSTTVVDGSPGFMQIFFTLEGDNVDCQLGPIMKYLSTTSGTNYYTLNNTDKNTGGYDKITYCNIYIPAP